MTTHRLEPHRSTLHGTFSSAWEPVLTIDPGDTVMVSTLEAGWAIDRPAADGTPGRKLVPRDPVRDNGHALCGPIAVRGAKPGMNLVIDIGELVPGTWGWTIGGGWPNGINEHVGAGDEELGLNWTLDRTTKRATNQFGQSVRMAPFFGVMGMPGVSETPVPSWTPRPQGGNIDCKELVAGTRLYLPIAIDGGLFSVGDGHAAQGDGEVSSTGIECPMDSASLTLDLNDDFLLTTPLARTSDSWITFGFDEQLDEAALKAVDAMLDLFGREFAISRANALALASVAVDLRVTQIVNGVRGVHAVLRDGAIDGLAASGAPL
jgi:acetamidase/formamidase